MNDNRLKCLLQLLNLIDKTIIPLNLVALKTSGIRQNKNPVVCIIQILKTTLKATTLKKCTKSINLLVINTVKSHKAVENPIKQI